MRTRCRDCGGELGEQKSTRDDVCDFCWENRLRLVRGEVIVSKEAFAGIQRAMQNGRGTAARKIKKAQNQ